MRLLLVISLFIFLLPQSVIPSSIGDEIVINKSTDYPDTIMDDLKGLYVYYHKDFDGSIDRRIALELFQNGTFSFKDSIQYKFGHIKYVLSYGNGSWHIVKNRLVLRFLPDILSNTSPFVNALIQGGPIENVRTSMYIKNNNILIFGRSDTLKRRRR